MNKLAAFSYNEHFAELKSRLIKVSSYFLIVFICSYLSKEYWCELLVLPLINQSNNVKIIYTGLTEAFATYLNLAFYLAATATLPFMSFELYQFIAPGLYKQEKRIAQKILFLAPFLFTCACIFVYFFILPSALNFFLSFDKIGQQQLLFEARITQYIEFIANLMFAFGAAFQLPVVLIILFLLKIITLQDMINKRRIAIVINFVLAALLTPPDVLSQIFLALPMCLLYEIAILICKNINQNHPHHD